MTNKILTAVEWQSGAGRKFYCNHPDVLKYNNAPLAFQMIWNMSVLEFINFVIDKYSAEVKLFKNSDGTIKWYHFYFIDRAKCHKFVLDTNRVARNSNYTIEKFLKLT